MILLFFLGAVMRRQLFEGMLGMDFSLIGATIGGELVFIISLFLLSQKFAFLLGLIALIIGGILGAQIFGDSGGGEFD